VSDNGVSACDQEEKLFARGSRGKCGQLVQVLEACCRKVLELPSSP
jgi:hypothetical protein